MTTDKSSELRPHAFAEIGEGAGSSRDQLAMDDLKSVLLEMTADLGQANMLVREVLDLKPGAVVSLNKLAGETTDLYVNGIRLAKGEVVVIGDSLHVRVSEIIGVTEQDKESSDDDM